MPRDDAFRDAVYTALRARSDGTPVRLETALRVLSAGHVYALAVATSRGLVDGQAEQIAGIVREFRLLLAFVAVLLRQALILAGEGDIAFSAAAAEIRASMLAPGNTELSRATSYTWRILQSITSRTLSFSNLLSAPAPSAGARATHLQLRFDKRMMQLAEVLVRLREVATQKLCHDVQAKLPPEVRTMIYRHMWLPTNSHHSGGVDTLADGIQLCYDDGRWTVLPDTFLVPIEGIPLTIQPQHTKLPWTLVDRKLVATLFHEYVAWWIQRTTFRVSLNQLPRFLTTDVFKVGWITARHVKHLQVQVRLQEDSVLGCATAAAQSVGTLLLSVRDRSALSIHFVVREAAQWPPGVVIQRQTASRLFAAFLHELGFWSGLLGSVQVWYWSDRDDPLLLGSLNGWLARLSGCDDGGLLTASFPAQGSGAGMPAAISATSVQGGDDEEEEEDGNSDIESQAGGEGNAEGGESEEEESEENVAYVAKDDLGEI